MNTPQKVLIGAAAAVIVIGGVAIGLTLKNTPDKLDISTIHTEAPTETMAPTTQAVTTEAPTAAEKTPEDAGTATSVTATLNTYTSGKVSIQYPIVDKMGDADMQTKVNDLLKSNALSFIKANGVDEAKDTLSVKCEVISVDRKRLTATYTGTYSADGAAHPVNVFYANTVNLSQALDLGFSDFTDAYTMAGYVLSDDVEFAGLSAEEAKAVLEYRSTLTLEGLTETFNNADFPLASADKWPESFSYEKRGTVCFTLPVPHALGDYVIVTFDPSTK